MIAGALGRYFRKEDPMRLAKAVIFSFFLSWMVWIGGFGHGFGIMPLPSVVAFAFTWSWTDASKNATSQNAEYVAKELFENRVLLAASAASYLFVFVTYCFFSLPTKQRKQRL
jgi:hypothetical protein